MPRHRLAVSIEENHVEGEPHAEGMHARAAWNQQTATGALAVEEGQPQQSSAEAHRHPRLNAQDLDPWEAA